MTETQTLRARIDELLGDLERDFPKQRVARALVAKACDISLIDGGALPTVKMLTGATSLLAGQWVPDNVAMFIETTN